LSIYTELFLTYGLKSPIWKKELKQEDLPALALVPDVGLLIVLEKTADNSWKCDGRNGIKYFETFPQGTIFSDIRQERIDGKKESAFEMFKRIAKRQKTVIIQAAVATLSINILALGTSFFTMQVYDRVIPTQGVSTLIALMIGVFIAVFLEMILKISRSSILDHASVDMDLSYSHDIFNRFLKVRSDALPKSIGSLSGQLQSYASVRAFISSAALYLVIDFPFILFFLAVIVAIGGWTMGIIPLIFLIASIIVALTFKKKIEILTHQSSMASHKKLGLLVETVENAESVKTTGASYAVLSKWNALSEDAIYDDIAIRHYSEMATYIAALMQQLSYISLIAWGAYLATQQQLTMGALIAISIISGRVLAPVAQLPNLFVQWGRAKIAVADLDNIYALPNDNEGVVKPLTPESIEPRYLCQNISFSYGENSPSVNIKNLQIQKGERIGILGVIGSGKSTMLKILAGIYTPKSGSILIDGIDMQHIARDRIVDAIGYLPQNVKLIAGTLRDNLLLGLVGVDDEQIMQAANKTGLVNLINSLPQGLDTPVPEGGESVSGGQKQLIAMTRMVISSPKVWLLDEPTANMDDSTERRILQMLDSAISPEQTLILVTHKPALLAMVSRLIVLTPQGIAMDGPRDGVLKELTKSKQARQTTRSSQFKSKPKQLNGENV
ncbi:MAG TPA: ATP-binding cassette domain-containing protein, partial [Epsilonproteobacteria bacterium]|nr:ATP-binding cassette domain-containing protein [Campylobacterota bacterium]